MIAKLKNGRMIPCPKAGLDGTGRMHTNLPLFYERNLDLAAEDGYYPVRYADKPDGDYMRSWTLTADEIVQTWTPYTPQPEPVDPVMERLEEQDAKIDYIAMMTGVDFEEVASDE